MLAPTAEIDTKAQPGTRTKVNPGHSWTVSLMSVLSRALGGLICEYVTGSPGIPGIPGPPCLSGMDTRGSSSEPVFCPRACHRAVALGLEGSARQVQVMHMLEPS